MRKKSNGLVSGIIVTAGTQPLFKSCLDSLKKQTYPHLEIIVINNGSKPLDIPVSGGQSRSPVVHTSPVNLFYAQSLNIGIGLSRGDFLLCLNDDAVLEENFIEKALEGFRVHARIGIVSGKIMRFDKKTIDSTGLSLTCFRTAGERGYGVKDRGQFQTPGYVLGATGAVAFYSREMLQDINVEGEYFDSDFNIFFEDLDISWRAHRKGWQGWYTPEAVAYHLRGGTVRTPAGIDKPRARRFLSDQLHCFLIRNRYLAIIKNESPQGFLLHLPCILLYEIVSWCYILLYKRGVLRQLCIQPPLLQRAFQKRRLLRI
jgi:GT2 family glycosyltransferase